MLRLRAASLCPTVPNFWVHRAQFDRRVGCDTLHLSYALLVLDKAWPKGPPAELRDLVDDMRFYVKRAICQSFMQPYLDGMDTERKPSIFPDPTRIDDMQAYFGNKTAEIARSVANVDLEQHTEMLAALNADMNEHERPEAEKRAAGLVLPLYYAIYTIQASFSDGQPYHVLNLAQAMGDSVDRALVHEMHKEYLADGASRSEPCPPPQTSHVHATQTYCTDAVCVVLAE